ncbi:MAG: hypothetical protein HY293_01545 [Planctomycetes bacterium]|nr:hypothetical protein [Planctomycetota bacterium]
MYHTAQVEVQDAINATCVLFWVVFAIFYCTHVHQSDDARDDERRALISEAWLDGRRARLLRRRSRRERS